MSRFLFVAPPLTGHVNPAAAVARALAAEGHEIAWAGPESFLRPVLGPDARIFRTGMRMYRGIRHTGTSDIQAFLEGYVTPLARFTLAAVDLAAKEFAPDVVVCDQHGLAGAVVAYRHGLPWATLMPTAMGLFANRPAEVDAWVSGPLAALWRDSGLPEVSDEERRALVFSPHLQVAFTTPAIVGNPAEAQPDHVAMVGPALVPREGQPAFDVQWLDPARPHLLVTIGTLTFEGGTDFLQRMALALEPLGERLQAVVLAPEGVLPDQPAHVRVQSRADVLALMPYLDGVVSHGGLNTVMEALWHGLPLVIAPVMLDHPMIADQVVRAGAGVRVDFDRATPEELRAAVLTLVDQAHLRRGAEAVAASFRAAGGAPEAAARLADLAARTS